MPIPNELWTEIMGNAVVQDARMLPQLMRVNRHFTKKLWYYAYRVKRPRWTYGVDYTDIGGDAWQELVQRQWDKERYLQGIGSSTDDQLELESATIDDIDMAVSAEAKKLEQLSNEYLDAGHERSRVIIALSDAFAALSPESTASAAKRIPPEERYELIESRIHEGSAASDDAVWVAIFRTRRGPGSRLGVWSCSTGSLLFSYTLTGKDRFSGIFWSHRLLMTAKHIGVSALDSRYKYYLHDMVDPPTSPSSVLIDSPAGFKCHSQHLLMKDKSLELVLLGDDTSIADQAMLIRYDRTSRQRLVLRYHGYSAKNDSFYDRLTQTGFFGVMVTIRDRATINLWSASTGRLLTCIPDDKSTRYRERWLTAPLATSDVHSTTVPRGPLRYLVMGSSYDTATDVSEEFIEVWHITLPASEFSTVRWQDTLAEGEMERIVPQQEPHLSSDPSERAQLQRLYRIPYCSVSVFHCGMLLGNNYVRALSGHGLTAVDMETGRVGLQLGTLGQSGYTLDVARDQLLYTTTEDIRILALPDHTLQQQYASLVHCQERLEQLKRQWVECRAR